MKRWAFSVIANRGNVRSHSCAVLEANSRDEAFGKAMRIARKLFPVTSGFVNHDAWVSDAENVVTVENVQFTPATH